MIILLLLKLILKKCINVFGLINFWFNFLRFWFEVNIVLFWVNMIFDFVVLVIDCRIFNSLGWFEDLINVVKYGVNDFVIFLLVLSFDFSEILVNKLEIRIVVRIDMV